MRDLYHNLKTLPALVPAVQAAGITGTTIDLRDAKAAAIVLTTGAIAGAGDFGANLQESDDSVTGFTDVAATQVVTDAPATLTANGTFRLGYHGFKRFIRLNLTKAGGTSIAAGAVAVLSPLDLPVT